MKFGIVNPHRQTLLFAELDSISAAIAAAGLVPSQIDFGTIGPGLGIIVYTEGLFDTTGKQSYFTVDYQHAVKDRKRLYGGPAVLFSVNDRGNMVSFRIGEVNAMHWYRDAAAVEKGIKEGKVDRPTIGVNEKLFWSWPEPKPDMEKIMDAIDKLGNVVGSPRVLHGVS